MTEDAARERDEARLGILNLRVALEKGGIQVVREVEGAQKNSVISNKTAGRSHVLFQEL